MSEQENWLKTLEFTDDLRSTIDGCHCTNIIKSNLKINEFMSIKSAFVWPRPYLISQMYFNCSVGSSSPSPYRYDGRIYLAHRKKYQRHTDKDFQFCFRIFHRHNICVLILTLHLTWSWMLKPCSKLYITPARSIKNAKFKEPSSWLYMLISTE